MTQIIIKTIKELEEWRLSNQKGTSFVPSMGNLHLGHKELIRKAKKYKENLVLLSIFINPLQFNDKEDLRNYPRTINKDIDLAFAAGADAIFIPSVDEIFPKNGKRINYLKASEYLSKTLCGISRKGHFDGVCTVVNRLINIVKPEVIFLGEKDWQQLLIIKEMVAINNIRVAIKSIDTQRDLDGIPYSSRNNLLLKNDREKLKLFSAELFRTKQIFNQTKTLGLKKIIKRLKDKDIKVEYLEHVNAFNLQSSTSEINLSIPKLALNSGLRILSICALFVYVVDFIPPVILIISAKPSSTSTSSSDCDAPVLVLIHIHSSGSSLYRTLYRVTPSRTNCVFNVVYAIVFMPV